MPRKDLLLNPRPSRDLSISIRKEADRIQQLLKAKSPEEIAAIIQTVQDHLCSLVALRAQQKDAMRFFSLPYAAADFDQWLRKDYWQLEEGAALLLGKSPDVVNRERLSEVPSTSPFAKQFFDLLDLAERAQRTRRIKRRPSPREFIAWAKSKNIAIPPQLAEYSMQDQKSASSESIWPWGTRETKLLRHLAAAASKFWDLYDSSEPSTAPTSAQVTTWLEARGVPNRVAEVMTQILRDERLPAGPRKPRIRK